MYIRNFVLRLRKKNVDMLTQQHLHYTLCAHAARQQHAYVRAPRVRMWVFVCVFPRRVCVYVYIYVCWRVCWRLRFWVSQNMYT